MITSAITVEGNGSAIERSSAMGTPDFRIFGVGSSGNLTLQETTISGGRTSGDLQEGGGVSNIYGILTVTNSTISGNSTSGNISDGGVSNALGNLTLSRAIVSGNSAALSSGDEIYSIGGTVNANNYNLFGRSELSTADALVGFTPGATDITATSDGAMPTALAGILLPLALTPPRRYPNPRSGYKRPRNRRKPR